MDGYVVCMQEGLGWGGGGGERERKKGVKKTKINWTLRVLSNVHGYPRKKSEREKLRPRERERERERMSASPHVCN